LWHRTVRWVALVSAFAAMLALMALPAAARVHHNDAWARQQFAKSERMREALNGRPAGERTRREYQRVIDAYRRVYFGSPTSSKADPSVVATAELMVEMGRRFDDDKILRGAVEAYRFLRKEYPGSKYRFEALFTIGEVYKDDLNDPEEARKTFEDFLHRYPRNRLADDAHAAVKEIDEASEEKERTAHKGKARAGGKEAGSAASNGASGEDSPTPTQTELGWGTRERRGELPRVTSVRHWSTPDYTRVAIDVEQDVKFYSQRIANPDRIFFDLRDTRLASTLVGKTFEVDDGFLKKIRVAEFKPGRTRIVLEVDELASYDAFLLPNPYRLIIDIHGKQSRAALLAKTHGSREGKAADEAAATGASSISAPPSEVEEDASGPVVAEKGQRKLSEKEHAIVARAETVSADTDAEGEGVASKQKENEKGGEAKKNGEASRASASGKQSNPASGVSGVVKTTVAVKGTNRRIPKTIVEPEDDDPPAAVAKAEGEKKRGENATAHRAMGRDNTAAGPPDESTTAAGAVADGTVEEAKLSRPDEVTTAPTGGSSAGTLTAASTSASGASLPTTGKQGLSSPGTRGGPRRRKSRASSSSSTAADTADLEAREARPTAAGDRSLTRALGLKIGKIVIDAGHGGHDTGTIGPNGLLEKDVVLDVAKRLGRLLETRLGASVIYTRRDDTFIPLETRTAIANRAQADLFISIHANSSRDEDARGVETYYLNFTSSPEALEVAARENAVSEKSIHELQDLVKKIALKEKIEESREFAGDVQESLYGGLALSSAGIRNRGVKKAPFIVLIGANMPSILAEISFVSNPTDERKLETAEHRQRIAESLYRGVARYAGGLSGVKVASKSTKSEGQ